MFTHQNIWDAIDALAARHKLSPSALARKAGLDPTTFNKSKRFTAERKARWPSTESLAKILEATGTDIGELVALLKDPHDLKEEGLNSPARALAGFAEMAGREEEWSADLPVGSVVKRTRFLGLGDDPAHAVEVNGAGLEPLYHDGDILILSSDAKLDIGDKIILKLRDGPISGQFVEKVTDRFLLVSAFGSEDGLKQIEQGEIDWLAKIIWASQ